MAISQKPFLWQIWLYKGTRFQVAPGGLGKILEMAKGTHRSVVNPSACVDPWRRMSIELSVDSLKLRCKRPETSLPQRLFWPTNPCIPPKRVRRDNCTITRRFGRPAGGRHSIARLNVRGGWQVGSGAWQVAMAGAWQVTMAGGWQVGFWGISGSVAGCWQEITGGWLWRGATHWRWRWQTRTRQALCGDGVVSGETILPPAGNWLAGSPQ